MEDKYVDLGLSVLWAEANFDVKSPRAYGKRLDLTEMKTANRWFIKIGGPRLPTEQEANELITKCSITKLVYYAKKKEMFMTVTPKFLFKITGPNGNHIIIPVHPRNVYKTTLQANLWVENGNVPTLLNIWCDRLKNPLGITNQTTTSQTLQMRCVKPKSDENKI